MNVHRTNDLSVIELYDQTQTSDSWSDGDIFVLEQLGIVGFLYEAWPVILHGDDSSGELHRLKDGYSHPEKYDATIQEAAVLYAHLTSL
jgi:hypothetical protein